MTERTFKLRFTISEMITQWSKQAGVEKDKYSDELRSQKYLKALQKLFEVFLNHSKDFNDEDFSRAMRFFMELPINTDISAHEYTTERWNELEHKEVDKKFPFKYKCLDCDNDFNIPEKMKGWVGKKMVVAKEVCPKCNSENIAENKEEE